MSTPPLVWPLLGQPRVDVPARVSSPPTPRCLAPFVFTGVGGASWAREDTRRQISPERGARRTKHSHPFRVVAQLGPTCMAVLTPVYTKTCPSACHKPQEHDLAPECGSQTHLAWMKQTTNAAVPHSAGSATCHTLPTSRMGAPFWTSVHGRLNTSLHQDVSRCPLHATRVRFSSRVRAPDSLSVDVANDECRCAAEATESHRPPASFNCARAQFCLESRSRKWPTIYSPR